jgi:ferredoxin
MEYVKTFDVTINETGKGVTRDDEGCTHCGACVAHCPTKALFIADPATREVGYNAAECIECLGCIRVCPYGACASAF